PARRTSMRRGGSVPATADTAGARWVRTWWPLVVHRPARCRSLTLATKGLDTVRHVPENSPKILRDSQGPAGVPIPAGPGPGQGTTILNLWQGLSVQGSRLTSAPSVVLH